MIKPVSQSPFTQFIDKARPLAVAVIRVAIQAIFISWVMMAAAATTPIRFQAIVLPIIALSATLFAAHFYVELVQ